MYARAEAALEELPRLDNRSLLIITVLIRDYLICGRL
jgi:hypothetical protein